ncbi:MAG: hypothetical protein AAF195_02490 [Pseudomonadota bacterium]
MKIIRTEMRIIRIIYIVILSLLLVNCKSDFGNKFGPAYWIFDLAPKNAAPEYKQGWLDGCETGLASMTNDFYKTFYTFQQTNEMLGNEVYYKAWKDTYHFCRHYSYGILRESDLRMNIPENFKAEHGSLNNVFTYGSSIMSKSPFGNIFIK